MKNSQKIKEKKDQLETQLNQKKRCPNDESALSFGATAFRASTDMLASIIVGSAIGYLGDKYLNIYPYGIIFGFIFGAIAGLLNVYRRLCRMGYGLNRR